jgi:hypothetical protein
MRKNIYLTIASALKGIKNDGESLIRHCDLWNENVTFIEEETFPMPAVFIEFEPIVYKAVKTDAQMAPVTMKLHIVTNAAAQMTADGNPMQEQSLEFFDIIDKITAALDGLQGSNFDHLHRIASYTNCDHGEVMESIETYACTGYDEAMIRS